MNLYRHYTDIPHWFLGPLLTLNIIINDSIPRMYTATLKLPGMMEKKKITEKQEITMVNKSDLISKFRIYM